MVAPRNVGRRLEASPAQVQEVRRLRKGGASLRAISKTTAKPSDSAGHCSGDASPLPLVGFRRGAGRPSACRFPSLRPDRPIGVPSPSPIRRTSATRIAGAASSGAITTSLSPLPHLTTWLPQSRTSELLSRLPAPVLIGSFHVSLPRCALDTRDLVGSKVTPSVVARGVNIGAHAKRGPAAVECSRIDQERSHAETCCTHSDLDRRHQVDLWSEFTEPPHPGRFDMC